MILADVVLRAFGSGALVAMAMCQDFHFGIARPRANGTEQNSTTPSARDKRDMHATDVVRRIS